MGRITQIQRRHNIAEVNKRSNFSLIKSHLLNDQLSRLFVQLVGRNHAQNTQPA